MGRIRVPAPGTRSYGTKTHYSSEHLQEVLNQIRCGQIGQREASRKYGIPRQTLVNKLQNKHSGKSGRPQVFSPEEETIFVQHCLAVSEMGIPISMFDLRCLVKSYLDSSKRRVKCFANNMPGWDWGKCFLERHKKELQEKFARNICRKRAAVNEETVQKFFENYEREVENVPPSNIFNFDETAFHDTPFHAKLLFRRSCRHPETVMNSSKSCYTVMFCGSADGNFLPPYIVFKGKHTFTDWLIDAPPGTKMNVSKSGWMEHEIFDDWFQSHFFPIANNLDGKKVIIGDNLSSHISINTLKLCEENNISFICLPPNATHLLQPLDVAYFSSLKTNWRHVLFAWRKTPEGLKKACLPKTKFCNLLAKTLKFGENTATENLKRGFEKCGLFPTDCLRVLTSLPSYARQSPMKRAVGTEFQKYLESVRSNDLNIKAVKRLRLPVEPGRSISVEEVTKYCNERNSPASKGARTKKPGKEEMRRTGPKTRGGIRRISSNVRTIRPLESNQERGYEETNENNASVSSNRPTPISCDPCSSRSSSSSVVTETINLANDFCVDDFVMVSYEGALFPGIVTGLEIHGPRISYKVNCMIKKGKHWTWPEKVDEMWYDKDEVIKK